MTSDPFVPGYGNRKAKIMLVGEAPAVTEMKLGLPFQGRAGEELNKLLSAANIRRDDIYITNVSLHPVKGDKDQFFLPGGKPSDKLLFGLGQLLKDIKEIRPNVVVVCGNWALWALTMQTGIMKRRGSILWSALAGVKVVPMIHPAALLRGIPDKEDEESKNQGGLAKYWTVCVWDLIRAKEQSQFPELRLKPRDITVVRSLDPWPIEQLDRLMSAKEICFDLETFGGLNLACIGFNDGDPSWSVVFEADHSRYDLFRQLLGTEALKTGQNLMYDCTMLDQLGIHAKNIAFDTMVAEHVLLPDLPKGLDFLTSIYTDIPYYKDEGSEWNKAEAQRDLNMFFTYCGKDVCATSESVVEQRKEIADRRLGKVFQRFMGSFEPMRQSTRDGVPVNKTLFLKHIETITKERDEAQAALNKAAGYELNVRSPKQVADLIYNKLKLSRGKSTNEQIILNIAVQTGNPMPRYVIDVRKKSNALSKEYNIKVLSPDDRLRCSWNIVGTFGARVSSSKPLWGPGRNMQNMPKKVRQIVVPDEGYEFLEFDQAQAETVIVAYLANDPIHMDCFRTGKDVHRVTACQLMGMPLDQWASIPKGHPVRALAKVGNHECNYNAGPNQIMLTVNKHHDPTDPNSPKFSWNDARAFRAQYLSVRPALQGYWESIRSELRNNDRMLKGPLGDEYKFLDKWSDTMLNMAYAYKPQGAVGAITSIGIQQVLGILESEFEYCRSYVEDIRKAGVKFSLQVHDSTLWQCPIEAVPEIAPKIMSLLEVPIVVNHHRICIAVEGKAGPTWYEGDMRDLGVSRKTVEL